MRQPNLGLNRLRTREDLVRENGLSSEMEDEVFSNVSPVQHQEDGTALYLEAFIDQAISKAILKNNRLSLPPTGSLAEKETQHVVSMWQTNEIANRGADLLCQVLERFLLKTQQDSQVVEPKSQMLTPEEAAKEMHLHVQTILAWCRKGKTLKGIKVGGNETNGKGGKWLIPREEIDRYLHERHVIHGKKKGGAK